MAMNSIRSKKALFLDRDGVINVEKNYVHGIEDFEFLPGIFDLCATARDLGFRLVVITNQAGIGRGLYTEADFEHLTDWMVGAFQQRDIVITRVYHCPHHPTAGIGAYRRDCFDRKPHPGMLLRARDELHLDMAGSVLIGDKDSDIEAGMAASVGGLIRLATNGDSDYRKSSRDVIVLNRLEDVSDWLRCRFGDGPDSGRLPR